MVNKSSRQKSLGLAHALSDFYFLARWHHVEEKLNSAVEVGRNEGQALSPQVPQNSTDTTSLRETQDYSKYRETRMTKKVKYIKGRQRIQYIYILKKYCSQISFTLSRNSIHALCYSRVKTVGPYGNSGKFLFIFIDPAECSRVQGVAIDAREGEIGGGGGAYARVTSLEGVWTACGLACLRGKESLRKSFCTFS